MFKRLYNHRFEFFFFTQVAILFGSLIIPGVDFDETIAPVLFLLNLLAGVILISKRKDLFWFFLVLLFSSILILGYAEATDEVPPLARYIQLGIYFSFYLVVTYEIIMQVWSSSRVDKTVIYGLITGFISLGLIGFFICLSIELAYPESFAGGRLMLKESQPHILTEQLMYFSFVSLMTVGYGDIIPVTNLAEKASVLISLTGQFYLVIVTAVVVGKFINQRGVSPKSRSK